MQDKLVKSLSGLGGTAALATGGVFLKNHLDEAKKEAEIQRMASERKEFIDKANANIKAMSTGNYEGLYPDGNSLDEEGKISWIFAVGSYEANKVSIKNNFSKTILKQSEKTFWDAIMKTEKSHILIGVDKKKEIDVGYGEYWIKYKEACLYWGSSRDVNHAAPTDATCMLPEKWETYKEKSLYKSYLEIKKEKEMDVMDFYGTVWRRFKSEKDNELPLNKPDNEVYELYKTGKEANKSDLFSNLTK